MPDLDPHSAVSGALIPVTYRETSIFSASHFSTSERSQPPEVCRCGKAPRLTHRKMVDRLTPTTRSTSVVVILWSKFTNRSMGVLVRGLS